MSAMLYHRHHPSILSSGIFGDSVTMWANIDPDIMLYVFLPPLIFGEAMSLNWHHVQGRVVCVCVCVCIVVCIADVADSW